MLKLFTLTNRMINLKIPSSVTKLNSSFLLKKNIELFIKRDDLIHNVVSGNKWRKLKYNLIEAKKQGYKSVLSFGGPYSNHLHALSYVCDKFGLQSIGVVSSNGKVFETHTQSFCIKHNMELHYIDMKTYRKYKNNCKIPPSIKSKVGQCFVIPEGGCNDLGAKGCEEIMSELNIMYDYVCAPVGTGCTATGIINKLTLSQFFLGFCAFNKKHEQEKSIKALLSNNHLNNWRLLPENHFGGFAKVNSILFKFIDQFKIDYGVDLDLIYNGKMLYYLFKLIENDFFSKNARILVLHTGGLQGVKSFNR